MSADPYKPLASAATFPSNRSPSSRDLPKEHELVEYNFAVAGQ